MKVNSVQSLLVEKYLTLAGRKTATDLNTLGWKIKEHLLSTIWQHLTATESVIDTVGRLCQTRNTHNLGSDTFLHRAWDSMAQEPLPSSPHRELETFPVYVAVTCFHTFFNHIFPTTLSEKSQANTRIRCLIFKLCSRP